MPGRGHPARGHVAFSAPSRVLGAEALQDAREWPEYMGGPVVSYDAAFVRDPGGNDVEATPVFLDLERLGE
jgi:hypothetical protein